MLKPVAGINMVGWRIGIRSFDGLRYYYYAHLRKDHPYNSEIIEGSIVTAGDVIGYLGMTGYSTKENVNNINVPHLHLGLQIIFNPVQKDGVNQIWIDIYDIVNFVFSEGDDNEKYFDDCVKNLIKSGLTLQKDSLLNKLAITKDMEERKNIILELQQLIMKDKTNK